MKFKHKNIINLFIICLIIPFFTSCALQEYFKKAILSNIPIMKNFVQKEFKTYTSITNIQDEMKLVTAKQQLDFITIMDGKDGRYLEISTFEVKAGIDCSKIKNSVDKDGNKITELPPVEILECAKIHSVAPRLAADRNNAQFYEGCIKPVNIAYEQKAIDYSVELDLLEHAKDGAQTTLKKISNSDFKLSIEDYKKTIPLPYLPLQLEIYNNYLKNNNIELSQLPQNQFNRDSLILNHSINNDWAIRFGDTGRRFDGTFEEFYQNVFKTNSDENNSGQERVEIFRYFDPMYPKENEILSYASDNYRTFFILNGGRIYYVDAVYGDRQTLINEIAPSMVYFATSVRKVSKNIEYSKEYQEYISNYFDVQENIRTNASRLELKNNIERLINNNIINTSNERTVDEKYFLAISDIKNLGRTTDQLDVTLTADQEFNSFTELIKQLLVSTDSFSTEETREKALKTTAKLDTKIYHETSKLSANSQYLLTWFIQKQLILGLDKDQIKRYEDDLDSGNALIPSRPHIMNLTDAARNEYFYDLFRNRFSAAQYFRDTSIKIDDNLKKSVRDNNSMFVYYKIPKFKELADGDIYEALQKQNNGQPIENSFILIFTQTEWNWQPELGGTKFDIKDEDIHALVFDDSTLRIFLNVGSQNFLEKLQEQAKKLKNFGLQKDDKPVFFHYGDWKNLRVTPENVTISGHNFGTKKITRKGKEAYRNTNDYAEKSIIAEFIDDLQHAYSSEDKDYYYDQLCANLEYQTQRYVYEKIFRPSPRMILDTREDKELRYNK
ncbi:MAG: DUF4230 domain-containing protein [Spirochaetia bacterium]|nr:DUF4230 domain-containing protein [Spirochaetia bacterium]